MGCPPPKLPIMQSRLARSVANKYVVVTDISTNYNTIECLTAARFLDRYPHLHRVLDFPIGSSLQFEKLKIRVTRGKDNDMEWGGNPPPPDPEQIDQACAIHEWNEIELPVRTETAGATIKENNKLDGMLVSRGIRRRRWRRGRL